ncbi:MAG: T9SS type A sorting domain-containing protein, partial [Flavobacteriales bacterium]|nr:T9SS type A sorting domain-containing protein [Flavobacteriales bacterium]
LAVLDGLGWTHYAPNVSTFPGQTIREIAFDPDGWAWMATSDGVVHTDLQEWRLYNDTDESYNGAILPGVNIASIAVRSDGLVCIGTLNAGFVYISDQGVVVYNTAVNSLPDNTALGVALDANGDRWAACPFGGLLRNFGDHDGGFWLQYITANSSIAANSLYDVTVDAADRKIVAFQASGVGFFSGLDDWTYQTAQNSNLPDNEVLRLSLDPLGVLWVGTANGGAARLDYTVGMEVIGPSEQGMKVFPDPAEDFAFVELAGMVASGSLNWSVFDLRGSVCASGSWPAGAMARLDVTPLPSGVYLLQVTGSEARRTMRFMVR